MTGDVRGRLLVSLESFFSGLAGEEESHSSLQTLSVWVMGFNDSEMWVMDVSAVDRWSAALTSAGDTQ